MSNFFRITTTYIFIFGAASCGLLEATCNCPDPDPAICEVQPTGPCTSITSANSYIARYKINGSRGAMTFIGNTLGLAKERCYNEPGIPGTVLDSIGAFTTIDPTQKVGSYISLTSGPGSPAGTTLDWTKNSSSALLTIPTDAIILYAELIWSGSFGYYCSDPDTGNGIGVDPNCVLTPAAGPIKFTTPDGVTHLVLADPITGLESQNPAPDVQPYYCGGNYTRTQNVTPILASLSSCNGIYTVGGVPATISALDNSHNAAGWTLAIVYHDSASAFVNNMTLFLGAQQASRASLVAPAAVDGFCAQTTPGLISTRVLVSAIEGDANILGDQMQFGPTPTSLVNLSGPNNLVTNFFGSQINDDLGNLITTSGTYCIFNQDPVTGTLIPNGRHGYDITNVDCSSIISGQTSAFAIGSTIGDDFMINALGIQISVVSPEITPIKKVNSSICIDASLGDTVNFTIVMENTGTADALDAIFQDTLETGLFFVPGSVTLNGNPLPSANPTTGIPLGTLAVGDSDLIEFDVKILEMPPCGNTFANQANVLYVYSACVDEINTLSSSNLVMITITN